MADLDTLKAKIVGGDDAAVAETQKLIDDGVPARQVLDDSLLPGMDVVGAKMKSGDMFIPEVLLSARTMQSCLDVIKPLMGEGESTSLGTVVLGTVEGDVHDIGKNLVAMLLEGSGFTVVNLGEDVETEQFVAAVREHNAEILGMSGLLTTTIPKMPETIQALKDAGLRDTVKVIVGGAPVSEAWAEEIGADGYGANASAAVDVGKRLMRALIS